MYHTALRPDIVSKQAMHVSDYEHIPDPYIHHDEPHYIQRFLSQRDNIFTPAGAKALEKAGDNSYLTVFSHYDDRYAYQLLDSAGSDVSEVSPDTSYLSPPSHNTSFNEEVASATSHSTHSTHDSKQTCKIGYHAMLYNQQPPARSIGSLSSSSVTSLNPSPLKSNYPLMCSSPTELSGTGFASLLNSLQPNDDCCKYLKFDDCDCAPTETKSETYNSDTPTTITASTNFSAGLKRQKPSEEKSPKQEAEVLKSPVLQSKRLCSKADPFMKPEDQERIRLIWEERLKEMRVSPPIVYNKKGRRASAAGARATNYGLDKQVVEIRKLMTENGYVATAVENKWACSLCSQLFSTKSLAERHLTTHLGFSAFQCAGCNSRFVRYDSVMAHMRTSCKAHCVLGNPIRSRCKKTQSNADIEKYLQ